MSIRAMNWALEQPIDDPVQKNLLFHLADMAGPENECFPSIATLARRTAYSESTVRRGLRKLVENGYVAVKPSLGRYPNQYYVLIGAPVEEPTLSQRQGSTEQPCHPDRVRNKSTLSQRQGSTEQPCQGDTPTLSQRQGNPVTVTAKASPSPPSTPLSRVEPSPNPHGNQGGCGGDFDHVGFVLAEYRQHGFDHPSERAIAAEAQALEEILRRGVTANEIGGLVERMFNQGDRRVRREIRVFRYVLEHLEAERERLRRSPPCEGLPSYYRPVHIPKSWGSANGSQ